MEPKEVIKNAVRERLEDKSRDELIDLIVDMSAVYILSIASGFLKSISEASCNTESGLNIVENKIASTLANTDKLNCQVCEIDTSFSPLKE